MHYVFHFRMQYTWNVWFCIIVCFCLYKIPDCLFHFGRHMLVGESTPSLFAVFCAWTIFNLCTNFFFYFIYIFSLFYMLQCSMITFQYNLGPIVYIHLPPREQIQIDLERVT